MAKYFKSKKGGTVSFKRMFIIDTMAMAFRNFHAFSSNPLTTSSGMPTSAVYGSSVFLMKLIEEEKPDYLVAASDSKEPTFRHEMYSEYKANRTEMPEDLQIQIPYIFRLFEAMKVPLLKVPGLEADDLIGSLTHKFGGPDLKCYIVSGDKDFMQLINENVFLYSPKKNEAAKIIDPKAVEGRFGCRPDQVIDILALTGDSADNVPGVTGIGDKGAAKLIGEYGSLEGIYENIDKITNKRQRNGLSLERDKAFLSKRLVTIKTDADVPGDIPELGLNGKGVGSFPELNSLFEELEFKNLAAKVRAKMQANNTSAPSNKPGYSANSTLKPDQKYSPIVTGDQLADLADKLASADRYCFDTETDGLDLMSSKPVGVSFSTRKGEGFYLPICDEHRPADLNLDEVLGTLKIIFSNGNVLKVGHNLKFDIHMLANLGIEVKGPFADTMVASYLIEPTGGSHSLDNCCLRYLNYEKIPTSDLMGEAFDTPMVKVPLENLFTYACEDADLTLRLYDTLLNILQDLNLIPVYEGIDMPLLPILVGMERVGVFIESETLETLSTHLAEAIERCTSSIYESAGEEFNINSTKQLQRILFDKLKVHEQLGVTRLKKTKSGFSTDVSVLEKLSRHPLAESLLEFRSVSKLKNTYVDTLPQLINSRTNRVHAQFHQTVTATGRLSSSDPNLQNIPIRTEQGRKIREAFKPQAPYDCIVSADYSQVELRILADLSNEENLIEAFKAGADIHTSTAAKIFSVDPENVTREQRGQAKAINFGLIYGMGPQRLSQSTGVSLKEAKDFIERYFATYPKIKDYIDKSISSAKDLGYSTTMSGRRRPIPELESSNRMSVINGQNIAVNSPVQGSAADLIKIAMIKIQNQLDTGRFDARMLLQIHDELVFEATRTRVDETVAMIKDNMEHAMKLKVPLLVEVGVGANWLEAH